MPPLPIADLFRSAQDARNRGNADEAVACLKEIVHREPGNAQALNNLGLLAMQAGAVAEAIGWYEKSVEADPSGGVAWCNLAMAQAARGNSAAAEKHFLMALSLKSDLFEAHAGLGELREATGDLQGARDAYCEALRLRPTEAHLHFRLGVIMRAWDRLDRAAACFRTTLRQRPDFVPALINLGETLQAAGETVESEKYLRSAIDHAIPGTPDAHLAISNLFITMQYNPAYSAGDIFRAHRAWGEKIEAAIPPSSAAPPVPSSGRKLRLGYVSADFCNHPAGRFLEPLLRFRDRKNFDVVCYACGKLRDERTAIFAGYTDAWRDLHECNDDAAETMIRADRIDILIDCTGHMADNRLPLFARRCAPLQVSFVGYPGTTGLSRIDYRFTDAVTDPLGADNFFSEKIYRLECGFCCFQPPENAPRVSRLPALTKGSITFGSLHSPARLNPAVIALWSRVLAAIPNASLLLFRTTLNDDIVARLAAQFASHKIDTGRIRFCHDVPAAGHLSLYETIDIALDTFPWSGHTTACEALWMGVPHVTLRGDRHAGRMTASVLTSVNLEEFIAGTPDDFVAAAARVAADIASLSALRGSLRERVQSSPLCDGPAFTAAVEAAYRECFRKRCNR